MEKMTTVWKFPFSMPGLNGNQGLMRMHYRKKKEWKDRLMWMILEQKKGRHSGKVRIEYHRNYRSIPMDRMDNLPASFKILCDALVACKVIGGDSEDFVPETPKYTQSKGEPMTIVTITDL